ncbi:MAG: hypothetical protein LLG42_05500 [Chloroflexi bacterium]|nr:hypothetical protein [Chloroflexota bacterium]
MQEIGPNVFIETGFAGVTLGVITMGSGVIMIDAPFLPEDIRSWRSSLAMMNGGTDRFLINLDAHVDRIVGARAMDCIVVGQEELAHIFQTRPFPYRSQSMTTGAEWENYESLGTFRWAPPELTFKNEMTMHWDDMPVVLQQCCGAELGSLWVNLPSQRILFLGDLVIPNQPPFLANAQIPLWVETLNLLLEPEFDGYTLIGGRSGVIRQEDIRWQIRFLEKVQNLLEELKDQNTPESEIEAMIPCLMAEFEDSPSQMALFQKRLNWGLTMYYLRNYFPENIKETEAQD